MRASHSLRSILMMTISIAALTACGSSSSSAPSAKTSAPMPPITEMDVAMDQPAPQPLPLSQSDTLTPVLATANAGPSPSLATPPAASETVTTLTTTMGVPTSVEERIARLEESVNALRGDYARIMPAFASLNTTNERISMLLDEIERETGKRPVMPQETAAPAIAPVQAPVTAATMAAPTAVTTTQSKTTVATTTPASAEPASGVGTDGAVTGVRIGEHGDKTRFVFDLTAKTKPDFSYDLDNAEKLLMVEMPQSGWSAAQSGKSSVSPLVSGWNAQKGANGGSTIAIELKKDARVLSTEFLKAEGSNPARLIMDIAAGG